MQKPTWDEASEEQLDSNVKELTLIVCSQLPFVSPVHVEGGVRAMIAYLTVDAALLEKSIRLHQLSLDVLTEIKRRQTPVEETPH
jgi:hypothetical protein